MNFYFGGNICHIRSSIQTYIVACKAVKYQCGMELREDSAVDTDAGNLPRYFPSHGLKDTSSICDI